MNSKHLVARIFVDSRSILVLSFLVPFLIRMAPELIMGSFLTGFDTIAYYVPAVLSWGSGNSTLIQIVASAPLFYALLVELSLCGVPLVWSLKVLAPVLLGCLGLAIYMYSRRALGWSPLKCLGVSCLATLYFVSLRVSWDMLRSEVGLIFFFVFLTILGCGWERKWQSVLMSSLMVLVALSHQLVSVIMYAVILAFLIQFLSKKEVGALRRLLVITLPSAVISSLIFYADYVVSSGFSTKSASQWFSLFGFWSVSDALIGTMGFLAFCFLPLLPFIWVGWKNVNSLELKAYIFACLVGILFGVAGSSGWFPMSYRWTLLLSFPLAFFTVEGMKHFKFRRLRLILSGILILLSCSFVFLPTEFALPYFRLFPNYVPSSMLQNSVALSDCESVAEALGWIGYNIGSRDVLLVHDAFHGWALLYGNNSQIVCYGYENPEIAAEEAIASGFRVVFLIWWSTGNGWHGQPDISVQFEEAFESDRIVIYRYEPPITPGVSGSQNIGTRSHGD